MRNSPLVALCLSATLATGLSGCILGDVEMRSFDNCAEYAGYMKRAELLGSFDAASSGIDLDFGNVMIADLDASGNRGAGPDFTDGGASSWTETNVQHDGVDEADLVKTDGTYLYAISGGKLVVSLAWPVESALQIAAFPVDGLAVGLYLYGDTVVVLSRLEPGDEPDAVSDFSVMGTLTDWRDGPATVVSVFDVSDPRAVHLVRETYTTGALRESRLIDNALYVVTTEDVGADKPSDDEQDYFNVGSALKWLSLRFDNRVDAEGTWSSSAEPACDCSNVWAPSGGTESIVTNVMKLDLDAPKSEFDGSGIVGPAGVVYASPTALYLASTTDTSSGVIDDFDNGSLRTDLHKFSLETKAPSYVASTSVPGVIPDRFGLSEHEGVLRIALFDTAMLSSGVSTLETRDGAFVELDSVTGLAMGETMTAARFVGDLGYLVTYVERKDPLFAIDLSEPNEIVVGGDLEISGWSDYLHPMKERGKLFAVGTDFEWDGTPVLSASIFDVSNVEWPKLLDRHLFQADGSEAGTDHHAFTYDPETGFVSIPSTDGNKTQLQVLKATAANGIKVKGKLAQPNYGGADAQDCRQIRRSVHMDGKVWAYSPAGLTAAELADPSEILSTLEFSNVDPCVGLVPSDEDRQVEVP